MPRIFDAHSHLQEVGPMPQARVLCGTCEADWEGVLARAAGDPRVLPMLGLHPWRVAGAAPAWAARLEALLREHRAGVGECGLDFARGNRELQEGAFRTQLRLARALHRPVAIHAVRAWDRLLQLLAEEGVPAAGALVHAYSGSAETARRLQAMGLYLSFSGDLLDPRRPKLRQALQSVSPGRLLLESDGRADLDAVLGTAARLRERPLEALAAETWENGQACFRELMT